MLSILKHQGVIGRSCSRLLVATRYVVWCYYLSFTRLEIKMVVLILTSCFIFCSLNFSGYVLRPDMLLCITLPKCSDSTRTIIMDSRCTESCWQLFMLALVYFCWQLFMLALVYYLCLKCVYIWFVSGDPCAVAACWCWWFTVTWFGDCIRLCYY
jgi:hypothetical protein